MSEEKKSYAYESFPVSPEAVAEVAKLREAFKQLAELINEAAVLKDGRYLALAHTWLEQASMWAIKSITHAQK